MSKLCKLLVSLVLGFAVNAQGYSEPPVSQDVGTQSLSDGECCDPESGCCPGGECCPTLEGTQNEPCPEEGCPCEVPCDDDSCGSGCPDSEGTCDPQQG